MADYFKALFKSPEDHEAFWARRDVKEHAKDVYYGNVSKGSYLAKPWDQVWDEAKAMARNGESIEFATQSAVADAIAEYNQRVGEFKQAHADRVEAFLMDGNTSVPVDRYDEPERDMYGDPILPSAMTALDPEDRESEAAGPSWLNDDNITYNSNAVFGVPDDEDFDLESDLLPTAPARGGAARNFATSVMLGGVVVLMSVMGSMSR